MANSNDDLFKNYKPRMNETMATSAHDWHIIEFESMCKDMIASALEQHDQQVQVDVQTTLNGKPTTMNGLVSDIKKQVYDALRKAFHR